MTNHSASIAVRDSVATIDPRWLPWLRRFWLFIALNSLLSFGMTLYFTWQFAQMPPARVAEGLNALGLSNETYFWYNAFFLVFHFLCFFVMGVFIFRLRNNERMAFFASIFFMSFGSANAYISAREYLEVFRSASPLYAVSFNIANLFAWPLLFAFCALFPDGRFVPRWMRNVALLGFVISIFWSVFPEQFSHPEGAMVLVLLAALVILFGGSFLAQVLRYRSYSTPMQRQQTKWLLYGLALIFLATLLAPTLFYLILPTSGITDARTTVIGDLVTTAASACFVILPLAVGIAILRYRLWDIDVLIRKTLTYATVVALLAVFYFGTVILLQQIFASIANTQGNQVITVVSTLAIAALFVPLRNRIQNLIDKRFYRKKYDAQQVLSDFANTVRDETDLEKLTGKLIEVVHETMQPASVSVWLAADKANVETKK